VIGEGPAIRHGVTADLPEYGDDDEPRMVTHQFVETIWVDPLFYAQTLSDEEGTVVGFSVTTRVRRFAPRFAAPRPVPTTRWLLERATRRKYRASACAHVRLGRTRFVDAAARSWGVPKVSASVGVRVFSYSEAWYFGNPGHYSDYVCSVSTASSFGRLRSVENLDWPDKRDDANDGYAPTGPEEDPRLAPWIEAFRRASIVTTWTVIQFPLSPETWPVGFGPHGDDVRTLP
jgi:hypothetical protein